MQCLWSQHVAHAHRSCKIFFSHACASTNSSALVQQKSKRLSLFAPVRLRACDDWANFRVIFYWPLIPVRQPCAWIMFWDRHVDIRLHVGPRSEEFMRGGWGLFNTLQCLFNKLCCRREEQQRMFASVVWIKTMKTCFYDMHATLSTGPVENCASVFDEWEKKYYRRTYCSNGNRGIIPFVELFGDLDITL